MNGFHYSDFKPLTPQSTSSLILVWLPLPHYLNAISMYILNSHSLVVPHMINLIFGSLTCSLAYLISKKIFDNRLPAFAAGVMLSFQPWFIGINVLGLTETLSSFFVILVLYFYLMNEHNKGGVASIMGMLTRYENWLFSGLLVLLLLPEIVRGKISLKKIAPYILGALAVVSVWSFWSFINVGDPFAWYQLQSSMVRSSVEGTIGTNRNFRDIFHYVWLLNAMTLGIFSMSIVVGAWASKKERLVITLMLLIVGYRSLEYFLGMDLGEERFIVMVLPFVAILMSRLFKNLQGQRSFSALNLKKKMLIALVLILLTILPFASQIWVFNAKVYVIRPEMRVGVWLRQNYSEGLVLTDSPTVIYFSSIEVDRFVSSSSLDVDIGANLTKRVDWLRSHNISYLVWHRVPYSGVWLKFPELADAEDHEIQGLLFKVVYVDKGWEHDYGVPDIFVYRIEYSFPEPS
ncbi:MAG: glycosyltransferase family 39 protein [Candidatus Bathyarchaeia archaeon]